MTDNQIRELFDTVPFFVDNPIEVLRSSRFIRSMSHCDSASVNTGLIYGTANPVYQGMTWREFLSHGKKMKKNIDRFTVNPEYYLSHERSGTPPFFCFQDGKGYVAEDGNHRACIAKFFLYAQPSPLLHGVHLVEVQTDARMENLFSRLKRLLPPYCAVLPVHSRETAREDGPGWSIAFFDNSLRIENVRRKGYTAEFKADEIEEGLLPALCNPFKRRFGPYRNLLN